jgi:hypothetical protein
MMNHARARLGLKRKDRSEAKMKAWVELPDGSSEPCDIDSCDILGPVVIPCYYEAGALTNKPVTDTAPCDQHIIIIASGRGPVFEQSNVGVSLYANSIVFAQMLAKIALGLAVANFGLTGFEPFVRNLILKNPDERGHWVGGFAGTEMAAVPSPALHRLHLQTKQVSAGSFIIVEIQLFAQ